MKRLFQLQFPSGHIAKVDDIGLYFESKTAAKKYRDEMNAVGATSAKLHVTYGPDHHLYSKGFVPGRFKGKHGGKVTSGVAKNKRHTHPDRANRIRQRSLRPSAAA